MTTGSDQSTVSNWKYFNSPEDGARVTKGRFKVIAPTEDNSFGNVISGAPDAANTFDKSKAKGCKYFSIYRIQIRGQKMLQVTRLNL